MNNNEEFSTVLATSSESATSATTVSNKRDFITKYWTLAVIAILMSAVIALSSVLIVVLKNKGVDKVQGDDPTSITQDFEEIVNKYQDRLIDNKDGTVGINLRSDRTLGDSGLTVIEEQDIDCLVEYSNMLDGINTLIKDGELQLDNDGNYYVIDGNTRDVFKGGRNQFYVRTKKILWVIPIPVGYYLALSTEGAMIMGLISFGFKWATTWLLQGKDKLLSGFRKILTSATVNGILNFMNIGSLFDTLYTIVVAGNQISNALIFLGGGIGSIVGVVVKIVLTIIASYFWDRVGSSFLIKGASNVFDSNNTVEMYSDLVLWNRDIQSRRY